MRMYNDIRLRNRRLDLRAYIGGEVATLMVASFSVMKEFGGCFF